MAKCTICDQRKAKRQCPALNAMICSVCCGSKRNVEIQCFPACEYLKHGEQYQRARTIDKLVSSTFPDESTDVFKNEQVIKFAAPLEMFFVQQFYEDLTVNDADIYDALLEIYSYRTGMIKELKPVNRCQELIFAKFVEIDHEIRQLDDDLKNTAILRILKSIKSSSGGALGYRNYLELIYSQFYSDGTWSHLFRKSTSS